MERTALIGLDTNILLRFVLEDDPVQVDLVQEFFNTLTVRNPGYVSLLVLCECIWTLSRFYRRTRSEVSAAVAGILNMPLLLVERTEIAQEALERYARSQADYGDCCIAVIAEAAGCAHTVTFDKAAAKLPGMRLLA